MEVRTAKINANLDRRATLWVKYAPRDVESGDVEDFTVQVTAITEVAVLREMVRAKAVSLLLHDDDTDGEIRLVYEGRVLQDGCTMADYPLTKARARYPKPYAGIVWISPLDASAADD